MILKGYKVNTVKVFVCHFLRKSIVSLKKLAMNRNKKQRFIRVILIAIVIVFDTYCTYNYFKSEPSHIEDIIKNIDHHNTLQPILNEDRFGPLHNDSPVIVVQVHKRIEHLRYLIDSLARAKHISNTLVIFSHDYYDESINELVRHINFCKVLQIFYPFSIQTHEHKFPGDDPNDCPRTINLQEAIQRKCNNARYPDTYGHYREAKFTQLKHHWWWKMNRVFDQLNVTRHHTGLVLFIEEDNYVAEDFLHVLMLMEKKTDEICPRCNILALARYEPFSETYFNLEHLDEVGIALWNHFWGFAFKRSTWLSIAKYSLIFCTYDDYNYDYSIRYLYQTFLQTEIYTMVTNQARVFHTGICGLHHEHKECNPEQIVVKLRKALDQKSHQLYPKNLTVLFNYDNLLNQDEPLTVNGGWADVRDHGLCLDFNKRND
ncbi:alpha-1,6-mannosyl-glycoprotein 2-beta-N-acetylglucosaminyltransferase-like isoform X2 [Contarinia nasturtii]|uniref:alpha-1,6-mannosyl-glycoprotein 2-beta-N-acetylglucosaminyltransferase-like isoform X2 n=1 Tax=Contarinia nasturtii TaxID=265458 RepID=UPI0012D3F53B|nr:alpha-1,6-mannosyl-glycoprotein 2-beta-N-acetylglucosaminyltransferase-like isoform X2 [Contarinia nasturtii]